MYLWQFLKKLKALPYNPAITLLGLYQKRQEQGLEEASVWQHPTSAAALSTAAAGRSS